MTARRAIPLIGIVFCVGVMLALMQTGVPLGVVMPPILLLAGQTNR